jgi:putative FmdB family regulatory protein
MPLYEYQCDQCDHRFEVIQKFSDAPVETCPKCGGPVKKLLSSPAIQFKGSGWYITDYARAGKTESKDGKTESKETSGKSESGGSATESKSDKKSETRSDSKAESKSDSKSSGTPSTSD